MADFTRIFLDTNVLTQGWPKLSLSVQNTLTAAKGVGVEVEIPEAVRIELERQWRGRTKDSVARAKELLRELCTLGNCNVPVLPTWEALEAAHQSEVTELLKTWSITITPMASIALTDLFVQASEQALGFGEQGKNFQDVVIFHSAVDRLRNLPADHGLLISNDGIFSSSNAGLQAYATEQGVNLRVMKFSEAKQYFADRLSGAVKQRYSQHKELAAQTIRSLFPWLQSFLNDENNRLEVLGPLNPFQDVSKTILLTDVIDVDVAVLKGEPAIGSKVRMSAILLGIAEQYKIRTAEEYKYPSVGGLIRLSPSKLPIEFGVTLLATFNGANYSDGEIQSITWGSPGDMGSVDHAKIHEDQE